MYKTAIFDLGNVLVFFNFGKAVSQLADLTGMTPDEIKHLLIKENLQNRYEAGAVSNEEIFQAFAAKSPKRFQSNEFFFAASNIFTPNAPIFPLLQQIKNKKIRLVLLSNTSPAHYEFLKPRLPILDLFDARILSFEVGAMKPHPKIYAAALQAAKCAPNECFYTDDIPEYIDAARTYGIDAEVFTDVNTLHSQIQKRSII